MRNTRSRTVLPLMLLSVLLPTNQARADLREPITAAVSACQAALPAFEGLIRKRPLALQNEGSNAAFVTCGVIADLEGGGLSYVRAQVLNNTAVVQQINCTLVSGAAGTSINYYPRTISVPANSAIGSSFNWSAALEVGAALKFSQVSAISCSLPPGTGIKNVSSVFTTT